MKTLSLCFAILGIFAISCNPAGTETASQDETAASAMSAADSIKRGAYLVMMGGCNDCHTPKIFTADGRMLLDSARLLSGYPKNDPLPNITDRSMIAPGQWLLFSSGIQGFVGPWGTSYAANLTPDVTGTGDWSFEQFKTVLTKGKYKGMENGRPIMPPMPWENFANMEESDMRLIWAYLRSLPPISNIVPPYTPPTQG